MQDNNEYLSNLHAEMYAAKVKEQNEDFVTKKDRDFIINLTDMQYGNLELKALKAGFKNSAELLVSFVGDLTGWIANGSDEKQLAQEWYERAFGVNTECYAFFRYHCHNYDYHIDDLIDALEDEELFEDMYQEYLNEYSHNEYLKFDSKDECKRIIEEITADERTRRAIEDKKIFNLLNNDKYGDIIIARFSDQETRVPYTLEADCILLALDDQPLPEGITYSGINNIIETEEGIKFDWIGIDWEIPVK